MKFCIISQDAHNALKDVYIGGAEKQCALIAKALARRGHSVTILDILYNGADCDIGGVHLKRAWSQQKGLPVITYLLRRLPSLQQTIRSVNADILYIRGGGRSYTYSTISKNASKTSTTLIWGLAHDGDLDKNYSKSRIKDGTVLKRFLAMRFVDVGKRIIAKNADIIFCQTREQLDKVHRLGYRAELVPNIFEPISEQPVTQPHENNCVWIGKLSGWKGEKELLGLAKMLPQCTFRVVGHVTDKFKKTSVYSEICAQHNIILLGRLDYSDALFELSAASVHISTSPLEGFSNTFLEAWACRCPVVSLAVNPSGLLSEAGLGYCAHGRLSNMADHINKLIKDPVLRKTIGEKAQQYVAIEHSPDKVAQRIETALERL